MNATNSDDSRGNNFDLTKGVLRDLQDALEKSRLKHVSESTDSVDEPAFDCFGMVYFGSLPNFAGGAPHYAMVSQLGRNPGRKIRMAPITSKKRSDKKIMTLAPGTLPPKKVGNHTRVITSYVILSWRARYSRERIREKMEYRTKLPDEKIEEARRILLQP